MRCQSLYQNIDSKGNSLGPPRRCTREAGHPVGPEWHELHRWGGRGRASRWPDSAAMVHPMARELASE